MRHAHLTRGWAGQVSSRRDAGRAVSPAARRRDEGLTTEVGSILMPEPIVPPWEGDPLSTYFRNAEHNTRASSVNWPDVYEEQKRADVLMQRVLDAIENERQGDRLDLGFPRVLIHRNRTAMLTAMRLAMSGQAIEAMPVLRLAIEEVWYALHIAKDPTPPRRAQVWWKRDDGPKETKECQAEFKIGNIRRTHEGLDPKTAAGMKRLYDHAITFGGHPNSAAAALGLSIAEGMSAETATVKVAILNTTEISMVPTIKAVIDVVLGVALTVALIYPEAFKRSGLGPKFNELRVHAAEVFEARARVLRQRTAARPE